MCSIEVLLSAFHVGKRTVLLFLLPSLKLRGVMVLPMTKLLLTSHRPPPDIIIGFQGRWSCFVTFPTKDQTSKSLILKSLTVPSCKPYACPSMFVANDVDGPRTVEYSPESNVCV